jgi:hypothetical protein
MLLGRDEATGPDFPTNGVVALVAADDGTWVEDWRLA